MVMFISSHNEEPEVALDLVPNCLSSPWAIPLARCSDTRLGCAERIISAHITANISSSWDSILIVRRAAFNDRISFRLNDTLNSSKELFEGIVTTGVANRCFERHRERYEMQ